MSWKRKIAKACAEPAEIIPYFLNKFKTRRVWSNGQLFHEYKGELFPDYLNHGNAISYILEKAQSYCHGSGVDIGASEWPFPGATPIQKPRLSEAYALDSIPAGTLDYVFSSHCLEHIADWQGALKSWIEKLKPGGRLFLYL